MKFFTTCNTCNFIRTFILLAFGIIIFLPFFSKQHDLTISITPMQISSFMIMVGAILFTIRAYRAFWKKLD